MATTLKDICKHTGLSSATVSRVLNNSDQVKESTRKKVQDVMDELDYYPSQAARALAGNKTNLIGVISPYIGSGFFAQILLGVDSVAAASNYHLMTAFGHHGLGDEKELVTRFIRERRADVLIIVNLSEAEYLDEMIDSKIPFIVIDTPTKNSGIPSVSIDNLKGMDDMMSHILEQDCKDIIVIAGPEDSYDSRERIKGCRAALDRYKVALPEDNILHGDFMQVSGYNLMSQVVNDRSSLPEAVVCFNDDMAVGVMELCREKGIKIPEELAVTGFDDSTVASLIGLTSVKLSAIDMGREAANVALRALENGMTGDHVVIPANLVIRDSSRIKK